MRADASGGDSALGPVAKEPRADALKRSDQAAEMTASLAEEIQDLYNRAPCGYHSLDADGNFVRINDTELEWLGYTREEILGRIPAIDLFSPKSQDLFRDQFPLFKARGWLRNLELEMVRKDGTLLQVLVNSTACYDESGNYVRSRTTVNDITEIKRAQEKLRRTNRELQAISRCNEVLMRAKDEQSLLDDICRIVCDDAGYRLAWVGYAEHDEEKTVRPVAWAGLDQGYVEAARITWADAPRGRGPTGSAIRTGESVCIQDFVTDAHAAPWREFALARGYRSAIGLPLLDNRGVAFGALMIYSVDPDAFTPEEFRLLGGLARDLAFGIGVLRDRAERRQSEAALAMANTEWSIAMDASEDVVYLLDLDRRVRRANHAFFRLTGTSPETAIGRDVAELVHPHRDRATCPVCQAHQEMRDLVFTLEADHSHNPVGKPMEITSRVVRDSHGVPLSIFMTLHDLSHDRELREVVKASEQRYRFLFEYSPIAKWEEDYSTVKAMLDDLRREGVTDLEAHLDGHPELITRCAEQVRILNVNQAALAMHDAASKHELMASLVNVLTPESFDVFKQELLCLWNGQDSLAVDTVVRTLGGQRREVTVYFSLCPGDESAASNVLISMVDLTERRQAEAEREKLQAHLLRSRKMESLGSLAGGVAHDMNNVLGAILGLASVHANEAPEGSRLRRGMETIISACERGGTLVKGLLGFARQDLAEERILDLNALVRDQVALLERTTLQRICLETDLQEPLRPVKGDPSALSHALMNLCVNAVDAMPEGGTLTLRTRNEAQGIVLEVRDTGEGMPPEVLEKALDPFFTTKPHGQGTGLGLPLVYGAVKAHRGYLEIQSQPSKGTTVMIHLPSCEAEANAAEEGTATATVGRILDILVVDDDDLIREAVSQLLEMLGHRATVAGSGEEAVQKLEQGLRTDAVILDMNMPGMGGEQTLPRIRALRPHVPVLLATGRVDQAAMDILNRVERVSILPKPFSLKDLRSNLDSL